jgi:hypothetical protein
VAIAQTLQNCRLATARDRVQHHVTSPDSSRSVRRSDCVSMDS